MNTRTIKAFILFLVSALIATTGKAADTLTIKSSELQFTSSYEKEQFENANEKGINYLLLALAIDTNTSDNFRNDANKKLDEVVADIKGKMNPKKGLDKNIKVIYDAVHQNLLKKYELVVPFHRIFKDGTYNCVTATILYALVLDKLNISYTIKETSNHVFIIADPDNERVYIETTDPIKGYYTISNEAKQAIIKMLVESKLISKEERALKTDQQLIDIYFNQEKNIKLKQAIGLQYYNQGITHGDGSDHSMALESYKKAYYLYPDIKTSALINAVLFQVFYNGKPSDKNYAENFRLFVMLNNNKALELKQELFVKIATEYSEKNDNLPGLTTYLEKLLELNPDSATQNILKQTYYATALSNHYLKKDHINSLIDLEKLIQLEPKNIRYKAAIDEVINSFTSHGALAFYSEKEIDEEDEEEKMISRFDSAAAIIERLSAYTDNPKAKAIRFLVVSFKIDNALEKKEYALVDKMTSTLEAEYKALPTGNRQIKNILEMVYSDVSGAYYVQRNYKESKNWLLRGLKTLPDNEPLRVKYNQIKDY